MNAIQLERGVSLQEAECLIDGYFVDNRIHVELSRYGSPLSSTVATLGLPDGSTCVGCGKGYEAEARVGAKFEAYEHHVSLAGIRAHSSIVSFDGLASQKIWENILPIDMIRQGSPTKIAALQFEEGDGVRERLLYPQFLIDYAYASARHPEDDADYAHARRYSCGTGLAVGVGFTEAAIHALSEVIERHAVGRFLAETFFYGNASPVRMVRRASLSPSLTGLLKDAEAQIGGRIDIIDVASGIQVPVFAAHCQDRDIAGVHVIGAGCSLYSTHAAARAVKELVQQYEVADGVEFVPREWARHRTHLAKYPRLLRCLVADMRPLRCEEAVMSSDIPPMNLTAHLRRLLAACVRAGMPAWVKQLKIEENGISLACAAMPQMERFSVVSLGNYAIPIHQSGMPTVEA